MKDSQQALRATFGAIATKMRADFEAQKEQLDHRGLTGRAREATLVAEYLEKYLPGTLRLRRNVELVATDGSTSPECDIVICDAQTPPLWTAGDVEVMPIECVYAVIEVKSRLDGRELDDAWSKIRRIKAMPKAAWYPDTGVIRTTVTMYGREWRYSPVWGIVFAYESTNLGSLADRLLARALEDDAPPHLCMDGVFVLSAGSLHWGNQTQPLQPTALPGQRIVRHVTPPQGGSMLPLLTLQMQGLMSVAHMPRFNFAAYFGSMTLGKDAGSASHESNFPIEV